MSRFVDQAPVPVRVGDCQCPGTPHDGQDGRDDGDMVWLRPHLTLEGGIAATNTVQTWQREPDTDSSILAIRLGIVFVLHGVLRWNFVDESGQIVPVTEQLLSAGLDWNSTVKPIAEAADDLYGEELLGPLMARASRSSAAGRTAGSTSATKQSSSTSRAKRPRQSRPSSRNTSAGSPPFVG